MMNTLLCSAGRRVELTRAFRRAYETLNLKGQVVALDIDPLAPALQAADAAYLVPRLHEEEFRDSLLAICRQHSPGVLYPLIDPDIPVLARHRQAIEETGVRVAVVDEATATIAEDKLATADFFREVGLRTPATWPMSATPDFGGPFPLFVKPRRGSGGKDLFKVETARQFAALGSLFPEAIVQEYIQGDEITSDVICDLDGVVLGVISRRRIEVRWGEVAKGVTVYDPVVTDACLRIADHLKPRGPITVQCIVSGGVPQFIEINARLGGGVPLAMAAGADVAAWLLAAASEKPIVRPPIGAYRTGIYLTRFDDSFILHARDIESLQGACLRS